MKKTLLLLGFILNVHATEEISCEYEPFPELQQLAEYAQDSSDFPRMKMSYTLNKECQYTVVSTVEIPNTDSLQSFMNKVIDPKVNFASANKEMLVKQTLTREGNSYKQVAVVKKSGTTVDLISKCRYSKEASDEVIFSCDVDADKSKSRGIISIRPFQYNSSSISCKVSSPGIKKCVFKTVGKAKSIPMVKGHCELASPGATETFDSTYRLAHYLTHGNVRNIKRGKAAVDKFYRNSKDHPQIGKSTFTIQDEI